MEEIKRIYTLLLQGNGLRIRDIAEELGMDKFQLAETMFSEECIPFWYQNDSSLWFAKEGAIVVEEEKKREEKAKKASRVTGNSLERYIFSESDEGLRIYLKQVLSYPVFSTKEINELFERFRNGDKDAFDSIVKGHLKLVVNLARMYRHRGLPMNDLIQEGNIGLLKAVELYDHTLNTSFIEFAKSNIFQSLYNALLVQPYLLTFPPSVVVRHYKLHKYLDHIEQQYDFELPLLDEEYESLLGIKDSTVYRFLPYDLTTIGVHEDLDTFESNSPLTDESLMKESIRQFVDGLLNQLNKRGRTFLEHYYGIGVPERTLESIGEKYNLTRERVRQIVSKSVRILKALLGKQAHHKKNEEQDDGIEKLVEEAIKKRKLEIRNFIEEKKRTSLRSEPRQNGVDWKNLPVQKRMELAKRGQLGNGKSEKKGMHHRTSLQTILPSGKTTSNNEHVTIFRPSTPLRQLLEMNILTKREFKHCNKRALKNIGDVQKIINRYGLTRNSTRFTQFTLDIWFKIVALLEPTSHEESIKQPQHTEQTAKTTTRTYDDLETSFTTYSQRILNLRQAKRSGVVIVAKPVLLLAVIDGITCQIIKDNKIVLDEWLEGDYKKLMKIYTNNSRFNRYSPINNPFWHLENDGFWHLHYSSERIVRYTTPSTLWIKKYVAYASLDDELWMLLKDPIRIKRLRDFIIDHKLSNHQ